MTKEMKNTPTIRFKNFTDAWEQRKFQEITRRCSKMAMSTGKNPAVEYEDVVPESGLLNKNIKLKNIYKKGISFDKNKIFVSFHSKCKVWEQRPDTVRQFKEPCQCGVPRIFQGAA